MVVIAALGAAHGVIIGTTASMHNIAASDDAPASTRIGRDMPAGSRTTSAKATELTPMRRLAF